MTPICPTCGCSLVRLGISRAAAARTEHGGAELLFCCEGCAELFDGDPDRFLQEIADWIVCPTCLAEKPKHLTVSITHEGRDIHFLPVCSLRGGVPAATRRAARAPGRMKVELLYFDGCPSCDALLPKLRELIDREGVEAEVELRRVESIDAAEDERFLGSPTLRIGGRDVDPDADGRDDFGLKCRLYRASEGTSGLPPERWIVEALQRELGRSER